MKEVKPYEVGDIAVLTLCANAYREVLSVISEVAEEEGTFHYKLAVIKGELPFNEWNSHDDLKVIDKIKDRLKKIRDN